MNLTYFFGHALDAFGKSTCRRHIRMDGSRGNVGPSFLVVVIPKSIDRILVPIRVDDLDEKWQRRPAFGPNRQLRKLIHL